MVTLVPQQASVAVGGSKSHAEPELTVLPLAQMISGGVVSTTVTVWLQVNPVTPICSPLSRGLVVAAGVSENVTIPEPSEIASILRANWPLKLMVGLVWMITPLVDGCGTVVVLTKVSESTAVPASKA